MEETRNDDENISKNADDLHSPQFQEMLRGFVVEKQLLEKRHKDEIDRLKKSFFKEGRVVSGSKHGDGETSKFADSIERSGQAQEMTNISSVSLKNEEACSGPLHAQSQQLGSYAAHPNNFSSTQPASYRGGHDSGRISTIQNGSTISSPVMLNGFSRQDWDFALMNGNQTSSGSYARDNDLVGYSNHHPSSYHGSTYRNSYSNAIKSSHPTMNGNTSRQDMNGARTFFPNDIVYHATSSGNHNNGRKDVKDYDDNTWNPTFYTQNLYPPRDFPGLKTDGDAYRLCLQLIDGPAMRVNTENLPSQIRPDLDLEDRLEQERELFHQRFAEEKRQLRQIVQEEFTKKFEAEKRKLEDIIQTLKKTNLELEYQKREFEVKLRHERESLELQFQSQRTEYERKSWKQLEEHRCKRESKFEAERIHQKEIYEGVIEKLKSDIHCLSLQLEEQNEHLIREKDNVVSAFEREINEFKERMRVEKEKTDSEVAVKLNSEITLLNSVNKSLREEIVSKEREKQALEQIMKDERSRTELNYENQIVEIESHFEMEKRALVVKYEEKVTMLLNSEKNALEENSQKSSDDLIVLKKENKALREIVDNSYKMEEAGDEMLQSLVEEKELLGAQLQALVSQLQSSNTCENEEYNDVMFTAQNEIKELREFSACVQRDLKNVEEENEALVSRVENLLREVRMLKKKKLNGTAMKNEKDKLLNEVTRLNEEIDKMFEDLQDKGRKEILLKEKLQKYEESLHRQESDNIQLKVERMENQNKLSVIERQIDDLNNELSMMKKRKVELDEENCNLKKDKASVDGKLTVLETNNDGLLKELERARQKISQLEEELASFKLVKLELQQKMTKMQEQNHNDFSARLNGDSDTSDSFLVSADSADETMLHHHIKRKKKLTLERQISKLKRVKTEYELRVERLKQDTESLEQEAHKQIEHNKSVCGEFISAKKDFEEQVDALKRQKEALDASILERQNEENGLKSSIIMLQKQKEEEENNVTLLRAELKRLRQANHSEIQCISIEQKTILYQVQQQIKDLESTKKEIQDEVERLERNEMKLRCNVEELQHESQVLSQHISQMKESVQDARRMRMMKDKIASQAQDEITNLGFDEVIQEIATLKQERTDLIRNVNELERKQVDLDIQVKSVEKNHHIFEEEVTALSRKKSELALAIFALRTEKFELETRVNELGAINVENTTNLQREETAMLRKELEISRENYDNIHSAHSHGENEVELVENEHHVAEDNLARLQRESLELEKTVSTLLRQKTELESEVAFIVDSKYRENRGINALREERLDLDTELVRLRGEISELRSKLSQLENSKNLTEEELREVEARKERIDNYVSSVEARLLIGHQSPVLLSVSQPNDYFLTLRDNLEHELLELREQKLSLEADLGKLRWKSEDGIHTRNPGYHEGFPEISEDNLGYSGTTSGYSGQHVYSQSEGLHQVIESLAQQRTKLSYDVQEMQVKKTDLDAQITNLEYKKLGLEQFERLVNRQETAGFLEQTGRHVGDTENESDARDSGTLVTTIQNQRCSENEQIESPVTRQENQSFELNAEECSLKLDFVNYSVEQMHDLRRKNTCLENKLTALEIHLHDAKYNMEKQTLEYQEQLKLVQNAVTNYCDQEHDLPISSSQSESGRQQQELSVIVERLKTFIGELQSPDTDQLFEGIREEIRVLNGKVEINSQKMQAILEVNSKNEEHSFDLNETNHRVDEVCSHIQDAEWNIERYNEVVSHIQQENNGLMDVVSRLEERLTTVGKSREMLQRKKIILQQLLETVSLKTGKDLLQQSNLIFELDKDTAI